MTPEEVESQRRIARALMQQGMDSSPVQHWTQALARGAQGVVGAFQNDWADTAEREGRATGDKAIADALAGKGDVKTMLGNPWSADPGRKLAVSQIQQRMQDESPRGKLELDAKRAQINAAKWKLANDQELAPLEKKRLQAQINQLEAKDQMDAVFVRALGGAEPAAAPAQQPAGAAPSGATPQQSPPASSGPPQSPIRPQSNDVTTTDPYLIRTQAGGPQQQPTQPQEDPNDPIVQTPAGPMPASKALKLGAFAAYRGKGDFGKMFADPAQSAISQGRLGKEAGNQNDKDQMAAIESVARLDGIAKSFDPKYLEVPNRIEQQFRSMQNKAGGWLGKPTPEQQQELMKFAQFKQQSVKNAALYVKYLSGVAVSEAEFARIMQTLPNAGTGMFDGDSAPEFAAKMQQAVKDSKAAIARANYLRTQGFKGKPWEAGVGLDDIPALIDQRGQIIEQSLRQQNPNADPRQIQEGVRRQLKQEFGI